MNRRILSIIVFFSILLSACSGSDRVLLEQADAVMEEHPDSAIGILQEIDREHISGKDLPCYALLMTQAQVKTDVPLDSDSLISIAYRKFGNDWWGDKGIRANFYTGEVFFNQDKQRDAMKFYLTAYEESKRLGNDYWRAKSAERIADLFFNAYNYPEAAKYLKEAIEFFGKSERLTNQRYMVAELAIMYINMEDYNEAASLLDSLSNVCLNEKVTDTDLLDYIRQPMIYALIELGRVNEIDSTYYNLLDRRITIDNSILKSQLHILKEGNNDYEKTLDSIGGSTNSTEDKSRVLYARYENAKSIGNNALALEFVDSLLLFQDVMTEQIINEAVTGAQRDFYSSIASRNSERSRFLVILLILSFIAFSLIVFLICRFHRLKETVRRDEMESIVQSFIELKSYSDKLASERNQMSSDINEKNNSVNELKRLIEEKDTAFEAQKRELDESNKSIGQLEKYIESKQNDIEQLEKQLDKHLVENKKSYGVLESLFKEKWITLNMLCDEYYEKGDSKKTRDHILNNIEKELKKVCTKKGLDQIEDATNNYMNGIVMHLRNECTFLNEKDIYFVMLIIAGFSTKAVCFMTGIKTGYFYVKKQRIITRISETTIPHRDELLQRLS